MVTSAEIEHARAYPFDIPKKSYVLGASGPREIADGDPKPDLAGRHPIIASGSNQSPQQLARKFDLEGGATVPVLRSRIENFDSVYSPHFSAYGSIAATLHFSPGVCADLFTTWLTDAQLQRMHDTEALGLNYDYGRLDGVRVAIDGVGDCQTVFAYIGRRGAFCHDNLPVALADVTAQGRAWSAMTQTQVQTLARDRLAPGQDLHDFIGENIDHVDTRHHRTATLAAGAIPFFYDGYRCL